MNGQTYRFIYIDCKLHVFGFDEKFEKRKILTLSPDQHPTPCCWRRPHHAWVSSHETSGRTTSGNIWFGPRGQNKPSTRTARQGSTVNPRFGTHIWGPSPKLDHYPHCEPLFLNHSTWAVTLILSPWHIAFAKLVDNQLLRLLQCFSFSFQSHFLLKPIEAMLMVFCDGRSPDF